jgi:hypothetical protein
MLNALKAAERERSTYTDEPSFDFDQFRRDLASLRLRVTDLSDRIALLDLYQDPFQAAKVRVDLVADLGDETFCRSFPKMPTGNQSASGRFVI